MFCRSRANDIRALSCFVKGSFSRGISLPPRATFSRDPRPSESATSPPLRIIPPHAVRYFTRYNSKKRKTEFRKPGEEYPS